MRSFLSRASWVHELGCRLDATAYANGALAVRESITCHPWENLSELAAIEKGPRFPRRYTYDASRGVPLLSSSDMLLADFGGVPILSTSVISHLPELLVNEGWTLISRSGTVGNTAYVRGDMAGLAVSEHAMRAVPREGTVEPGYLFAFLSSWQGQALLKKSTYGSVVQHIEPHHIADLPVPLPDPSFREHIHALVAGAAAARTEATQLLDRACAYFDSLAGPMPSAHEHAFASSLVASSALSARLDAFHHVGWAAETQLAEGEEIREIADVVSTNRVPRVYVKRGIPFVSGIDVFKVRPDVRVRLATHIADRFDARIKAWDLAVQGSGQRYGLLGRAAFIGSRMDGWASTHDLFRIRAQDRETSARIFAFIRSNAGRRAMLRHSYGTSIPHVNPHGIRRVQVPRLPSDLLSKATAALELREQADQDEEAAIREVEAWLA